MARDFKGTQRESARRIWKMLSLNFTLSVFLMVSLCATAALPYTALREDTKTQVALSAPLTVRWHYDSEFTVNLTPAADGDKIYLPLAGGTLVSLRSTDGQLFWKTDIGGELSASPVADGRGVYIASETIGVRSDVPRALGALRLLGSEGGVTLWMRTLPMPLRGVLAMNETTLFGGASDGRIYALVKKSGEIAWMMQHNAPFSSQPVLNGARLYVGCDDGNLFALNQTTGKIIWRYRTHGAVRGRPVVINGIVYFGSEDGYVYALMEESGRLRWRKRTGAGVQAVAEAGGGILVASLDNFVYFLSLNRGDQVWKRQLSGRLAAQPLVAIDGALFTPLSGDAGVVLDPRDGKQINTLPIGEDNNTSAAPIIAGELIFLTTRHGLMAFSRPPVASQSSNR